MDPPPPPSREEAPAQAEKRPLDAADDTAETAAKKQRLADPSSPIDPKDVEGLKEVGNAYFWRGRVCSLFSEPGVS